MKERQNNPNAGYPLYFHFPTLELHPDRTANSIVAIRAIMIAYSNNKAPKE
jgi:hypothetical protein